MQKAEPSFDSWSESSKFFVDVKGPDGTADGKAMIRLNTVCVVVTTAYGDKVAFAKTNRGQQYRDSRGRKVTGRDSWGDPVPKIAPLFISEAEVQAELCRLLGCSLQAARAFRALQV